MLGFLVKISLFCLKIAGFSENIRLRCRQAPQARKIGNFSHFHNKIQSFHGEKQLMGTGTTFLTGTGMALGAFTVATPLRA